MATDVLEIANKSFVLLGAGTIMSLSDGKKPGNVFNAIYPTTRDAVLRAHPWNSVSKRVTVAPNTPKPPFEWDNSFDMPDNCLRAVSLYKVLNNEWTVEGRKILANAASINLKYIVAESDVTKYDALLVEALAARLASDMAQQLVDDILPNHAPQHRQITLDFRERPLHYAF